MKELIKIFHEIASKTELQPIDYRSVPALRDLSPAPPVLHIPNWPYQKRKSLEFIVYDFSFIGILNKNEININILQDKIKQKIRKDLFFEILNDNLNDFPLPVFILVSYDYGLSIEEVIQPAVFYQHPVMVVAVPGNGLMIDHSGKKAWKIGSGNHNPITFSEPQINRLVDISDISWNVTDKEYYRNIEQIRNLIREGEVYQINYTVRLSSPIPVSPYKFFQKFYQINNAPYSFYLNLGNLQLISNSPERFIRISDEIIETEPIKGTIQRGNTPEEDDNLKQTLLSSEKDRAELSMIVDLLRNDLNRICATGTVQVTDHARLETYENVHHLVSTIQGKIPEFDFLSILDAVFPGGSITGCPKIAAMNFISKLEKHNRSFYTGSFFIYFPGKQELDSSILIRTAIVENDFIHFHVGGGIVIDSEAEAEYRECQAKAASFIKTLKNIL